MWPLWSARHQTAQRAIGKFVYKLCSILRFTHTALFTHLNFPGCLYRTIFWLVVSFLLPRDPRPESLSLVSVGMPLSLSLSLSLSHTHTHTFPVAEGRGGRERVGGGGGFAARSQIYMGAAIDVYICERNSRPCKGAAPTRAFAPPLKENKIQRSNTNESTSCNASLL